MQPLEEAQQIFWSRFTDKRTGEEIISSRESAGRVTAAAVFAKLSSPSFHSAAMDGLAVKAEVTFARQMTIRSL